MCIYTDVDMRRSLPPQAPLPQASTAESVHVYKQKHFPHAYNHELQQQYQMLRRQQEMRSTHHPHAEEYAFAQAQTRTNPPIRGQMQAHTQQQRQQEQYYNFHDSSSSLDRQASTQAHTYTQSTSGKLLKV